MTRLTLLFLVAALVVPGAAFAMPSSSHDLGHRGTPAQNLTAPDRDAGTRSALDAHGVDQAAADRKAQAIEKYYASYGTVKPVEIAASAPAPAPMADVNTGPSWFGALGIGVALMLLAGGLGVYAGRTVRPRHIGA